MIQSLRTTGVYYLLSTFDIFIFNMFIFYLFNQTLSPLRGEGNALIFFSFFSILEHSQHSTQLKILEEHSWRIPYTGQSEKHQPKVTLPSEKISEGSEEHIIHISEERILKKRRSWKGLWQMGPACWVQRTAGSPCGRNKVG